VLWVGLVDQVVADHLCRYRGAGYDESRVAVGLFGGDLGWLLRTEGHAAEQQSCETRAFHGQDTPQERTALRTKVLVAAIGRPIANRPEGFQPFQPAHKKQG
jgi:hypothetical protein